MVKIFKFSTFCWFFNCVISGGYPVIFQNYMRFELVLEIGFIKIEEYFGSLDMNCPQIPG